MAEIINLRRVRKAAARRADVQAADAARLRHGLTKAEREAARLEAERVRRALDGAAVSEDSSAPR